MRGEAGTVLFLIKSVMQSSPALWHKSKQGKASGGRCPYRYVVEVVVSMEG
jgi:hypothetical protein